MFLKNSVKGMLLVGNKKFEYDVCYVNNISFLTDVNIFFKTFAKVF